MPVQAGTGTHIYAADYDKDGVADLNEYENAVFTDTANFIKIFTPTDEFEKVRSLRYNQNLSITPKAIWHGKTGMRKFVSKLSTRSFLQIDRKVFQAAKVSPFNPFDRHRLKGEPFLGQNTIFNAPFASNKEYLSGSVSPLELPCHGQPGE